MEILWKSYGKSKFLHQNPDFWEGGEGVSSFSNGISGTKRTTHKKS